MARSYLERFARMIPLTTVDSVRSATMKVAGARRTTLGIVYENLDDARGRAAAIKDSVLDNLKSHLLELETNCKANGTQVHWCRTAESARETILEICQRHAEPGAIIAKAKSMATEEIHLNEALEESGYIPVETDLGEYVIQIDHDTPSHIVAPIIHKNRRQVAESFSREGLGPYTEVPEELAMQARQHLRSQFKSAKIGISGVNFAISSTGRIVLVENEGNNRYSTTAPDVHIALMGIEKILPSESDLPMFLRLLAGSATGQKITTYVHMISGPRRNDETDGPKEVHLILLDNGRTRVMNGPYRSVLRCIRCGACLNTCPVYRQTSGHAYDQVYSGPIGAVLAPALNGVRKLPDLAKASSLCGLCEEVCPVKIPLPDMLLKLRAEANELGVDSSAMPWGAYAVGATSPSRWKLGLTMLPIVGQSGNPMMSGWTEFRVAPERKGRSFREWWNDRS